MLRFHKLAAASLCLLLSMNTIALPVLADEVSKTVTSENTGSESSSDSRATSQDLTAAVMSTNPEDAAAPITQQPEYDEAPYITEFD